MRRLEITCRFMWFIAYVSVFSPVESNQLSERDRLDPEWSETIELLQYDYEETGSPPTDINPITSFFGWETSSSVKPLQPGFAPRFERQKGWDLVGKNQVPYYALIYMPFFEYHSYEPDPEKKKSWYLSVEPGKACGAILVSNNKILTICGCVYYWYMKARYIFVGKEKDPYYKEFLKDPQGAFNFTIYQNDSVFKYFKKEEIFDNNGIPKMFVLFEELHFEHNARSPHYVDSALEHYNNYESLSCRGTQSKFNPSGLKFGLTVLHIKPSIQNWDVSHFVPWPPEPLLNLTVKADSLPPGIKCRLVTMGALPLPPTRRFRDDYGNVLVLSNVLVDIEMRTVPFENCTDSFPEVFTSGLDPDLLRVLTCVEFFGWEWSETENKWSKPQLSGGLPGSPILSANGFVAGFLIDAPLLKDDLSGATRQHHHYHLMGNFALEYYDALDEEVGKLIKYSGIREPLAREDPDAFISDKKDYSTGNEQEMVPLPPEATHSPPPGNRGIAQRSESNTAPHTSLSITTGFLTFVILSYSIIEL